MCGTTERGLSLIELVVFIVVMGVGIGGILLVYNQVTRASVDPMVRKQALAIAASLLEEIELKPFTYCDPDDANVYVATSTAGCTTPESALVAEASETRYAEPRFDNVNDYNGFAMGSGVAPPNADIKTANGHVLAELSEYSAIVTITSTIADFPVATVAANDALKIVVSVSHVPTGINATLQGYRLRYAPNSP
jgi:MSHA pilin protein MshD